MPWTRTHVGAAAAALLSGLNHVAELFPGELTTVGGCLVEETVRGRRNVRLAFLTLGLNPPSERGIISRPLTASTGSLPPSWRPSLT